VGNTILLNAVLWTQYQRVTYRQTDGSAVIMAQPMQGKDPRNKTTVLRQKMASGSEYTPIYMYTVKA